VAEFLCRRRQTSLGPFLAAFLASSGWAPARVGYALTFGGLVTVALQPPAGALVDTAHRKRLLIAANLALLVCGTFLLLGHLSNSSVFTAQFLIGSAAPLLGPTLAAITLGIVGAKAFDRQFGKNQAFKSAGNVYTALVIACVSYRFGFRAIFAVALFTVIPALLSLFAIDSKQIDFALARGARDGSRKVQPNASPNYSKTASSAGALATMVGIGAALSNTIGGVLIQRFGYQASFTGLAGIALAAFALLWFTVPETLPGSGDQRKRPQAQRDLSSTEEAAA
jgi:predicted MFS family arabinose efflux permease